MVVGVILAVVLVTSAGILLFNLQNKAVLARQQIRDTYEMLRTTQRLAADVARAETAQRNTVRVIDPSFAAAFDRAAVQSEGEARSLSTMAAANPKLGSTVLRLVGVVDLEVAHLREMIASPQANSAPPTLKHAILQPALSAEIEPITAELRQRAQAEVTLLVEEDKHNDFWVGAGTVLLLVGALLVTAGAALLAARDIRRYQARDRRSKRDAGTRRRDRQHRPLAHHPA